MTPNSSKWKTLLLLSYGVWVFTVPAHGQLDTQRVEKARRAWQVTTAVPDSIWKTFQDSLWQDTSYQAALLRTLPPLDSLPYSERSMLYSRMGRWYATALRPAIRQALANVFIHGSGDYEVCWENMYVLSENGQEGDFSPAGLDTLLRIMRTPKFRSLPLYPLINRITWPAGVAFVDSIFRHAPAVDTYLRGAKSYDPQFYSRRWRAARELARQGHRDALSYMLARAEEAFSKPDRQELLYDLNGLAYTLQPEALAFILKLLESDYEGDDLFRGQFWGYSDFLAARNALSIMMPKAMAGWGGNIPKEYVQYRAAFREYVRWVDLPKWLAKERARE